MTVPKPTFYPDATAIGDTTAIALTESAIATSLRTTGYAFGAKLAAVEYDEMFNELTAWVKYLEQLTNSLPFSYANVPVNFVNCTAYGSGGIAVNYIATYGQYVQMGYNIHLEICIQLKVTTGILTSLAITLPSGIACASRYVNENGLQFVASNTDYQGPQLIVCNCGFNTANNVLLISQSSTVEGTRVPFILDSNGYTKFSISIDYEMNH